MKRRDVVLGLAAMGGLSSFPGLSFSAPSREEQSEFRVKLYETIPDFMRPAVLDMTVGYHFSFGCPFCRAYRVPVRQWAIGLPSYMKYEEFPIIGGSGDMVGFIMAMLYAHQKTTNPDELELFAQSMYDRFAGKMQELQKLETLGELLEKYGPEGGYKGMTREGKKLMDTYMFISVALKFERTPTITIDGAYRMTPDFFGGDVSKFVESLNAMTNARLMERGYSA